MTNGMNLNQILSTGSKGRDMALGGLIGLAGINNKEGYYVPTSQWLGNGLAETGTQYMKNPNYSNPYDMAEALGSMMRVRKQGNLGSNSNSGSYPLNYKVDPYSKSSSNFLNMLGPNGLAQEDDDDTYTYGLGNSNPYGGVSSNFLNSLRTGNWG